MLGHRMRVTCLRYTIIVESVAQMAIEGVDGLETRVQISCGFPDFRTGQAQVDKKLLDCCIGVVVVPWMIDFYAV